MASIHCDANVTGVTSRYDKEYDFDYDLSTTFGYDQILEEFTKLL